jgi:hypothetical protein
LIDTDKYEGHTERPWEIHGERICAQDACEVGNVGGEIATLNPKIDTRFWLPNSQLIADAPLLLEEIKRLREGIKELAESWTNRKVGRPSDLLVLAANELKRLIE